MSDHQGPESGNEGGQEEARAEPVALYQPLGEVGEGQAQQQPGGAVPLCSYDPKMVTAPCARYALSLGQALHWVKRHATKILRSGLKAVIGTGLYAGAVASGAIAVFGTAACIAATDGLESVHCLGIALGAGATSQAAFVAGTLAFSSALHEWF